jgi:hypothetical protein
MRNGNLRIIALLLLLAFTQKLGLRVLLHNKYHAAAIHENTGHTTANNFQIQCDCLDEALAPLTRAEAVALNVPETPHTALQANYKAPVASVIKIFRSLRAPPAA